MKSVIFWDITPCGPVEVHRCFGTTSKSKKVVSEKQMANLYQSTRRCSQSQSYFTTGGLPPISSSWRQAPWDSRPASIFQLNPCNILSNERICLPFTIAAGPRQHSHAQVWVPRDSWPHFTVSDSRLPQPGGPGPRIYIPQEKDGPVTPPGTGFPFRRLLRLAGLRWRYSTPPPHRLIFPT
jgi:hypothetical protein